MTTNNNVNTSLAGQTGTGLFVGATNPAINNVLNGYNTTATAGTTTTLTASSNFQQFFTGSTFQNVIMPSTATLVLGQSWIITNKSTGIVSIFSDGSGLIATLGANTQATVTCILTSGTTAASWSSTGASMVMRVVVQAFISSGTYTPTPGMLYSRIDIVGGGGAGGGTNAASASTGAGAGGGGSGGYGFNIFTAAQIGTSQVVTLGAGGTAVSGGNGGNGGTSSVGALITALGGTGGSARAATALIVVANSGAGGGLGTGGAQNYIGNPGSYGITTGINAAAGNGGGSIYGGGGAGSATGGSSAAGTTGQNGAGSGGSGSVIFGITGANLAGGNGGSGGVYITEYVGA